MIVFSTVVPVEKTRAKSTKRQSSQIDPQLQSPASTSAPNRLARHFQVSAPDEKWVSDLTDYATRDGRLYLAIVIDLYPRRIMSRVSAHTHDTRFW